MNKDPAVLFYISDWLTATAEMDSNCRGWYLNLLLHNYDKGTLPNDVEKLAVLANVKFSEYPLFEQTFQHVLKHKFEIDDNGRLCNPVANVILQSRELFKDKKSRAGKVSVLSKFISKNYPKEYKNSKLVSFIKENFNFEINFSNQHMLKQMFEQTLQLYRNENENENKGLNNKKGVISEKIKDIPTIDEFLTNAKIYCNAHDIEFEQRKRPIEAKYNDWVSRGWKDGNGNEIINWKTKFANTIGFIKPDYPKNTNGKANTATFAINR